MRSGSRWTRRRDPAGGRAGSRTPAPSRLLPMPTFNSEEVARLAALARIDLTPDELTKFAGELEVIAHAVEKVSELATADVPATSHPIPLTNVYREDVVEGVVDRDAVLASAPAAQDGKFLVPQILGEEA